MKVFVNTLTEKDILELKEAFLTLDTEKTGLITVKEL
jgi:Ca2+-binding EF-hand superfamily protein